jgi:hypothetical protein
MRVFINDGKSGERKLVEAELIKDNKSTMLVKLPDGNIILRKKARDLPPEKG